MLCVTTHCLFACWGLPIGLRMTNFIPDAPVVPDRGRWRPVFRGYPEGYDVLTELGWISLETLLGQPGTGNVLSSTVHPSLQTLNTENDGGKLLGDEVPFQGNNRPAPTYGVNDMLWERFKVRASFPRLATVDPSNGLMFFVQPEMVIRGQYEGRLIRVKMKGVDFMCAPFTDLWVKPKYSRNWKFVLADDIVRNKHSTANYLLLNKYVIQDDNVLKQVLKENAVTVQKHYGDGREHSDNSILESMYGDWTPASSLSDKIKLPIIGGGTVIGLTSNLKALITAPITVNPKKHVTRERIWNHYKTMTLDRMTGELVEADFTQTQVPIYNIVTQPYHNLVIRKTRVDNNPRTPWVGNPVVVGDGFDKAELLIEGIKGLKTGGSYSPFRPDWRNTVPPNMKDKE